MICTIHCFVAVSIVLVGSTFSYGATSNSNSDPEIKDLFDVLKAQRIDYYRDATRIVIAERFAQTESIDDLKSFVGQVPDGERYTNSWIRENIILVDALIGAKSESANSESETILKRLLAIKLEQILKGEVSGDRLVALQSRGAREMAFPLPAEEAAQQVNSRIETMTSMVKGQFTAQRKVLADRLASLAVQTGGVEKLSTVMKDFPDSDIRAVFDAKAMRAIFSDQ